MEKEFVSYNEALELKQLGFDEECFGLFVRDKSLLIKQISNQEECEKYFGGILAPTFSQAFRWFRKKHNLVHRIDKDGGWWVCAILDLYDEKEQGTIEIYLENCYPNSYEEAELACLIKLIEIVKK